LALALALALVAMAGVLVGAAGARAAALDRAGAPPTHAHPPKHLKPARVAVGHVTLSAPTRAGGAALLIPVHYPIAYSGRVVPLRVTLGPGGAALKTWLLHERVAAERLRAPELRRRFTFVHRLGLRPSLARAVRDGLAVRVRAGGVLDVNEDGVPELLSRDRSGPRPALLGPGNGRLCNSLPRLRIGAGKRTSIPLPACTSGMRWRIAERPDRGSARIVDGRLVYTAPRGFRGATALVLRGRGRDVGAISAAAGGEAGVPAPLQIIVGPASGAVVRALGDSVTAGFGYYGNGGVMPFLALPECRPAGPPFNDSCSSNSEISSNAVPAFEYVPDYGLANNISWAAQWANRYGVTNYENLAISGSEPKEWAPGGILHEKTAQIESEDPDYILLTIGANPLLSEVLFGFDNMRCALYTDIFGNFAECVERAFAKVDLQANLRKLYADLVENTKATVFLMQYPVTVPSVAIAYTSTQIAEMSGLLDREIARAAAEVSPTRLQVVAPPHFDVGVDISPVYPSDYSCSRLGFAVDGPSVQSEPTQDQLEIFHPFSFCPGPVPSGPPWVISGDSGIHPSAAGYAQMASQVPAPQGSIRP
jgi:lysophospholipase L1-like esterase